MRIAMIGQKGVPATHGGIERHVEELGARLAALGHDVTVFTRPNYTDPGQHTHRGMRLRSLPTIGTKHLDAIVHSLIASAVCLSGRYDVVHYHGIGPCLASPIARLRTPVVATIHGQDWRRQKWGRGAAAILHVSEWMALRVPQLTICVSETLAADYRARTGRQVEYEPNGVSIEQGDDTGVLDEFGLREGGYLLFAGRLVPEKGAHYLIAAHAAVKSGLPLVIAGDTSNSEDYVQSLKESTGQDVIFTGYQYGARLAALFRHAALFVLPSDLEGLPIVLLEALAYGVPVLASDIPPNVEVLGRKGTYFVAGDTRSLSVALEGCMVDLPRLRFASDALREQAIHDYDWGRVAAETVGCYRRAVAQRVSNPASARTRVRARMRRQA